MKTLPFGAVWDRYCETSGVPVGRAWLNEIKTYEERILADGVIRRAFRMSVNPGQREEFTPGAISQSGRSWRTRCGRTAFGPTRSS